MKTLTKTLNGPRLDESTLESFELKHEIRFPDSLRYFFIHHNGSSFEEYSFKGKHSINTFLPLLIDFESFESSLSFVNEDFDDYRFIPFAIDPGGWAFCVSIISQEYGKVYLYRFDSGEDDPFLLIANSFEEFIDGLQADSPLPQVLMC